MSKNTKIKSITVIVTAIVILCILFIRLPTRSPSETARPIRVSYACDRGKTIVADYMNGAVKPGATKLDPPVPTGSAVLTLGDGRTMTLLQTISADGARYANADESIVFWNKGNGLIFMENNQQTYTGCLQVADDPGGLPKSYENGAMGFSLRYPTGFIVDDMFVYQELGPGKDIHGVKFTIPTSMATGTNLGKDSYLSVENIPNVQTCNASIFLDAGKGLTLKTVDDSGTTYSIASSSGAGAGNRYEETVYAIPGTNPCLALRYFVHYSVFENYPAGTVKEFDKTALLDTFDLIRRTIVVGH